MSILEEDVLESGRAPRRRVPRRLVVALVVVLALVAGWIVWHERSSVAVPTGYGDWVTGPTRGDLAGDGAAVTAALDAWDAGRGLPDDGVVTPHLLDEPLADARLSWIGTVDGQTAAVVYQPVELTRSRYDDDDLEGRTPGYVFGFLGPGADGAMRIWSVSVDWGSPDYSPHVLGGWVSQDPAVAVLLDLGWDLAQSASPVEPEPGGAYVRTYDAVTFGSDGVAVLSFLPGENRDPALLRVGPIGAPDESYGLPGGELFARAEPTFAWQPDDGTDAGTDVATEPGRLVPIAGLEPLQLDGAVYPGMLAAATERALTRSMDGVSSYSSGFPWVLGGVLPSGEQVLVGGFQVDGSVRAVSLVGHPGSGTWLDGGPLNQNAVLPVAVRLADGAGWVVGAPGATLSYRAPGDKRWIAAGDQAAFLPDADAWDIRLVAPWGTVVFAERLPPVAATE